MRILHVLFSLNNGGIEHFLYDILNKWNNENDQLTFLLINNDYNHELFQKYKQLKKIKFVYFNRKKGDNKLLLAIKLWFHFIKNKYGHFLKTAIAEMFDQEFELQYILLSNAPAEAACMLT